MASAIVGRERVERRSGMHRELHHPAELVSHGLAELAREAFAATRSFVTRSRLDDPEPRRLSRECDRLHEVRRAENRQCAALESGRGSGEVEWVAREIDCAERGGHIERKRLTEA